MQSWAAWDDENRVFRLTFSCRFCCYCCCGVQWGDRCLGPDGFILGQQISWAAIGWGCWWWRRWVYGEGLGCLWTSWPLRQWSWRLHSRYQHWLFRWTALRALEGGQVLLVLLVIHVTASRQCHLGSACYYNGKILTCLLHCVCLTLLALTFV